MLSFGIFIAHTYSERYKVDVVKIDDQIILQDHSIKKEVFDASYIVEEGDNLSSILDSYDIQGEEAFNIINAFDKIHSLSKIKIGNIISINFHKDRESVKLLQYQIDNEKNLKLEKLEDSWIAREEIIEYEIKKVVARGEIDSSLFEIGVYLGLDFATILKMSDILSGEIDFSSDIQKGDSFKILYEKKFLDNEFILDGKILAVEFNNQGETFKGYHFEIDNKEDYYDENGDSLRKIFLKSPLNFKYISSGYSNGRFHPILKRVMPHKAIDYAAAYGTPIISVGDGKVIFANWRNGYGYYVIISHANSYITQYAHLSGFGTGIKYGARVEQGQTIGFVGSTGFSTGPHLDFSMKKNGVFVNPLTIDLPSGESVRDESKEEYFLHIEYLEKQLNK